MARLAIILALGLALRLGLLWGLPDSSIETGDTRFYALLADNLLAGHGFSSAEAPPYLPSVERPPGYPAFIAAVWAFTGRSYPALAMAQIFLDLATVALIFFAARRRYGPWAASAAAALYAVLPFSAGQSVQLMSEVLASFCFALALYAHTRALEPDGPSGRWALASGLAWGLVALARSYLAPLAAVAGGVLWWELRRGAGERQRGLRSRGLQAFVALGLGSALLVGGWVARNAHLAATTEAPLVLLEQFGSRGVYLDLHTPEFRAWYASYDEPMYWVDWRVVPKANYLSPEEEAEVRALWAEVVANDGRQTPEMKAAFVRITKERYAQAPLRLYVWRPISVALKYWLSPRASTVRLAMAEGGGIPSAGPALAAGFLALNCAFFGLALLGMWRRTRAGGGAFLWAFPITLTVILTVIVHRESRLVMPLFPVMAMAAGVGLEAAWVALQARRVRNQG